MSRLHPLLPMCFQRRSISYAVGRSKWGGGGGEKTRRKATEKEPLVQAKIQQAFMDINPTVCLAIFMYFSLFSFSVRFDLMFFAYFGGLYWVNSG